LDTFRRVEVRVPHALLDGDLRVLVNGNDVGKVYSKVENYTIFGLESPYAQTHIEIIGTSVVPEFGGPAIDIIMTASTIAIIVGARTKIWRMLVG
jgi:hypothetical protein